MSDRQTSIERHVFSRRGITVECLLVIDPLPTASKIEQCYRKAAECLLDWLEHERLTALVEEGARSSKGGRAARLHYLPERWRFELTAHSVGKYLSVCLTVTAKGAQFERRSSSCRVWDREKGILCPTACFLPARKTGKYDKWEYSLEENSLKLRRKGKLHKISKTSVKETVKM